MNSIVKPILRRLCEVVLGLAAGCLALRIARLAESFIPWVLIRFGNAAVMRGRIGEQAALPSDAPWALHALQAFGEALFAVIAIASIAWLVARLPRAVAPAAVFLAFWVSISMVQALAVYARLGRGPVQTLVNAIGLPAADAEFSRRVFALLCAAVLLYLLSRAIRGMRLYPLTAFLIPGGVLYLCLPEAQAASRFFQRVGIEHLPLIVGALATVAAWQWKPRNAEVDKTAFAALTVAGAVAFFVPVTFVSTAAPGAATRWVEEKSTDWRLFFEKDEFDETDRAQWLRAATLRSERFRERLGIDSRAAPIRAHVAKTWQAFQQIARGWNYRDAFYPQSDRGPVVLAGPGNRPADALAEALMTMRAAWGEAASDAMARAIARRAVGDFHGNDIVDYAERIACEEQAYPAADIFAVDRGYLSPLVRDAVSGAWVEGFVSRHGVDALKGLYSRQLGQAIAMCRDCTPACSKPLEKLQKSPTPPPYQKGISFSHEVGGDWGYGSESADRELQKIRALGATAVALVPYSFTAAPDRPTIRFRTDETDERLLRSLLAAKALGLTVMLKPHIWAGRLFHGDIAFSDEARFKIWFEQYRRWLLHFARFAELHGVDLLAIGNELAGLTVHESSWRGLIADIRGIYGGHLTYAAHWNGEFEKVEFWDQLDSIGVNFYFPLASPNVRPAAESAQITEVQRRIQTVSEEFDKPILFTEVGFPALKTAASRPWEENSSGLDSALQKHCYDLWFQEFSRSSNVMGMYWWKWPTHGRGGPFDTSHRPVGKPALEVLRTWFATL